MKALISTIEPRETGYRVAQVVEDDATFGFPDWAFWAPCPDGTLADQVWYDPTDQSFKPFPLPSSPVVEGAQPL